MHGLDVGTTWTRLAADAAPGDNTLTLADAVDCTFWREGAEIIIAPTGFEPLEKEKMTILSCDGTTLTLNDTLQSWTPWMVRKHFHVPFRKENRFLGS